MLPYCARLSQGTTMAVSFRKQSLLSRVSPAAIFFDLDNTLVETRKADNQTCRKVCDESTYFFSPSMS